MNQLMETDSGRLTGAAVATPIASNGGIDANKLITHCQWLAGNGVDSLALFGTTGEGSSFSQVAKMRALAACLQGSIAPERIGVGMFENASTQAGAYSLEVFSLGCRYVLLAPPCYFKDPDDDGLFGWFADAISATAGAGQFVLYNIPQVTTISLSVALIHRLVAAFPGQIAGVKDSSGDWSYTEGLIRDRGDLDILIGHEGHLVRGLEAGASGCISGLANLFPSVIDAMVCQTEPDERIDALIDIVLTYPVIPCIKGVLAHVAGDDNWRRCSPPLSSLSRDVVDALGVRYDLLFK